MNLSLTCGLSCYSTFLCLSGIIYRLISMFLQILVGLCLCRKLPDQEAICVLLRKWSFLEFGRDRYVCLVFGQALIAEKCTSKTMIIYFSKVLLAYLRSGVWYNTHFSCPKWTCYVANLVQLFGFYPFKQWPAVSQSPSIYCKFQWVQYFLALKYFSSALELCIAATEAGLRQALWFLPPCCALFLLK